MFFFFPFDVQSEPVSYRSNGAKGLPLLPAPGSAKTASRADLGAGDFGDFFVDLVRKTIEAFTTSLTALGNAANALFAQLTATLSWDRLARNNMNFLGGAFGAQNATSFFPYRPAPQDAMALSPFLMQGFNPFAINPWTAFAEGMNFWASLWMPAAPQHGFHGKGQAQPQGFMAKVSAPNGFSWGFSFGA